MKVTIIEDCKYTEETFDKDKGFIEYTKTDGKCISQQITRNQIHTDYYVFTERITPYQLCTNYEYDPQSGVTLEEFCILHNLNIKDGEEYFESKKIRFKVYKYIGFSNKVKEIMKDFFTLFENTKKEKQTYYDLYFHERDGRMAAEASQFKLTKEVNILTEQLDIIFCMTLWGRLKFLFTNKLKGD